MPRPPEPSELLENRKIQLKSTQIFPKSLEIECRLKNSTLCRFQIRSCVHLHVGNTFRDLKESFWGGDPAQCPGFKNSQKKMCPRDNKVGCAIVDALEPEFSDQMTDFVSWCWDYKVADVISSLAIWKERRVGSLKCGARVSQVSQDCSAEHTPDAYLPSKLSPVNKE